MIYVILKKPTTRIPAELYCEFMSPSGGNSRQQSSTVVTKYFMIVIQAHFTVSIKRPKALFLIVLGSAWLCDMANLRSFTPLMSTLTGAYPLVPLGAQQLQVIFSFTF